MNTQERISNIQLIKLPNKKYEITWTVNEGEKGCAFLTEAGILRWANSRKIYGELRDFARNLIRTGEYIK